MAPSVLVVGFGAVGITYSYVLSQGGAEVTGIARSAYATFAEKGGIIDLRSEKFGNVDFKPYRLVKDAKAANDRIYDYIIVCVKALPDVLPTASVLAEFLDGDFKGENGNGPTVVLIQNGIGIETDLQKAYPNTPIISVSAWIGVNLLPNSNIVVHGMLEKLIMGLFEGEGKGAAKLDPAGYSASAEGALRLEEGRKKTNAFAELLKSGGGGVEVVPDIQVQRFQKNLWNASFSTLCTLARSTVAEVVSEDAVPTTLPIVRRSMLEVLYVARAMGYGEDVLPASVIDDTVNMTVRVYQVKKAGDSSAAVNDAGFKPSMLLDLEAGRPLELEAILGSVIDQARRRKVETPRLDYIYGALKVYQIGAVARATPAGVRNRLTRLTSQSKINGTPVV